MEKENTINKEYEEGNIPREDIDEILKTEDIPGEDIHKILQAVEDALGKDTSEILHETEDQSPIHEDAEQVPRAKEEEKENAIQTNIDLENIISLLYGVTLDKAKNTITLEYNAIDEDGFPSLFEDNYSIKAKYQAGLMELIYNIEKQTITDYFHIYKIINNQTNYITDTYEFIEQIQDEINVKEILERTTKKLTIYLKNGQLYLDIDYTYKYKTGEDKIRCKTYKITKDITEPSIINNKLLIYYAKDLNYKSLEEFIRDNRKVKFKRKSYQSFMERYGDFINSQEIAKETKKENELVEENIDSEAERKNPIGKIVFFKYEEEEQTVTKAVVFFKDGSYKTVSVSRANIYIDILSRLLNKDRETLETEGYIENDILEEQVLKENLEKYRKEVSKVEKEKKVKRKKMKPVFIATAGITLAAIVTSVFIGIKSFIKRNDNTKSTSTSTAGPLITTPGAITGVENKNQQMEEEGNIVYDYSNCTWNQMIDYCRPNSVRTSWMSNIKAYLSFYNKEQASAYEEKNSEVRAAHTFKEAEAYYLACNKVTPDKIYDYFGNQKIKKESLMKNLQRAIKQNAMFHNIQTDTSNENLNLFKGETAKKRYENYSQYFANINKTSNVEKKIEYIEKIYDMFRKDLPNMSSNNYDEVKASTAVMITEFAQSLENIKGLTINNSLSTQEKNYIDNLLENVLAKKFKNIENNLNIRVTAEQAYPSLTESQEIIPTYKDMMEKMTQILQSKGIYSTDKDSRNIATYKSYMKNTNLEMPKSKQVAGNAVNQATIAQRSDSNILVSAGKSEQMIDETKTSTQEQTSQQTSETNKNQNNQTSQKENNHSSKRKEGSKLKATLKENEQKKSDALQEKINNFIKRAELENKELLNGQNNSESKEESEEKKDIVNDEEQNQVDLEEVGVEDITITEDNNVETSGQIQNDLPQYSIDDIEVQYEENRAAIEEADVVNRQYLLSQVENYMEALENMQQQREESSYSKNLL